MAGVATKLSPGGRVVIPAEYRRVLGLKEGDELILTLEDGTIRIDTRRSLLRQAQAIVDQYAADDPSSWSEELIRQRQDEDRNG